MRKLYALSLFVAFAILGAVAVKNSAVSPQRSEGRAPASQSPDMMSEEKPEIVSVDDAFADDELQFLPVETVTEIPVLPSAEQEVNVPVLQADVTGATSSVDDKLKTPPEPPQEIKALVTAMKEFNRGIERESSAKQLLKKYLTCVKSPDSLDFKGMQGFCVESAEIIVSRYPNLLELSAQVKEEGRAYIGPTAAMSAPPLGK